MTGHSYIVYGPLANGAITLMFEGVPTYPDASRFWQVVEKHKVNIFYTAPTAIRALMREGDGPVKSTDRSSLRLLGSVGEPINPEAWMWYHEVVGDSRLPDCRYMVADRNRRHHDHAAAWGDDNETRLGNAAVFGIKPVLVDNENNPLDGAADGNLCIDRSWPGQMRTVYGDHERFIQTYFTNLPRALFHR